ncbi:MAG: PAS domain S-box protein, partial [Thermodesulfobacteriota bacterium]
MAEKPTYEELERRVQELETDSSQLKQKLHEARFFSEEIMRYMTEGLVLTDTHENVIFINHSLSEMFGYPPEEIIGKCWLDMVSPEHRAMAKEIVARRAKGHTDRYEIILCHKDGHKFPVMIGAGPRFDKQSGEFIGTMGVVNDITEHKRVEEALQEKSKFLQNIIHTTSDLIAVTDMKGNFKFIGPSHRFLGYDPDSLVGRNVMELVHPDDYQETATAFAEFQANREDGRTVEYRYRRADGVYLWFETVGKFLLDDTGNPKEILFSSRDFTERKRAEGELKRIEWMLSRKPVSNIGADTEPHDQGYGDLTELNHDGIILKSIGHERLKNFANDYLDLLGTSSAIYEANGDYAFGIFASGWCRMMDSASRKLCHTTDNVEALKSGRWLCHESCWTDCAKKAITKKAEVDIECNGGIRMYAEPIFAGGEVIGVINFGYGDPPKDPEKLKKLAETYHLNCDDLLREADAYDSRPPYITEMAKKRLSTTAKLIGSMVETKQAMEALRDSEEKHRRLFETMAQGVVYQDADGSIISANPAAERILGISFERMQGKTSLNTSWRMIKEHGTEVPGTDHPAMIALRTGETVGPVVRGVFHPDKNAYVWLSITAIPLFQPGETKPFQAYATFEDVTERKQAIEALEDREAFIKATLDNLPVGVAVNSVDPKVHFTYMNDNFAKFYRTTREALAANDFWEVVYTDETFREKIKKRVLEDCAGNDPERMYWEDIPVSRPGRKPFYITAKNIPLPERNQMVSTVWDVTERKQAEEALRDQLDFSESLIETARAIILVLDTQGRIVRFNSYMEDLVGYDSDEVKGMDWFETFIKPQNGNTVKSVFQKAVDDIQTPGNVNPIIAKDGRTILVEWYDRTLKDKDGSTMGVLAIGHDITERKRAEEEREKLQSQLLQSQKMESVGRLAGGVAHDFNNMLGVILGHLEFALEKTQEDNDLTDDLKEIQQAAQRSTDLTKKLLAFARKQTISPKRLALNDTVESMLNMLRRLIGEDIDLEWKPAAHIWPVK